MLLAIFLSTHTRDLVYYKPNCAELENRGIGETRGLDGKRKPPCRDPLDGFFVRTSLRVYRHLVQLAPA